MAKSGINMKAVHKQHLHEKMAEVSHKNPQAQKPVEAVLQKTKLGSLVSPAVPSQASRKSELKEQQMLTGWPGMAGPSKNAPAWKDDQQKNQKQNKKQYDPLPEYSLEWLFSLPEKVAQKISTKATKTKQVLVTKAAQQKFVMKALRKDEKPQKIVKKLMKKLGKSPAPVEAKKPVKKFVIDPIDDVMDISFLYPEVVENNKKVAAKVSVTKQKVATKAPVAEKKTVVKAAAKPKKFTIDPIDDVLDISVLYPEIESKKTVKLAAKPQAVSQKKTVSPARKETNPKKVAKKFVIDPIDDVLDVSFLFPEVVETKKNLAAKVVNKQVAKATAKAPAAKVEQQKSQPASQNKTLVSKASASKKPAAQPTEEYMNIGFLFDEVVESKPATKATSKAQLTTQNKAAAPTAKVSQQKAQPVKASAQQNNAAKAPTQQLTTAKTSTQQAKTASTSKAGSTKQIKTLVFKSAKTPAPKAGIDGIEGVQSLDWLFPEVSSKNFKVLAGSNKQQVLYSIQLTPNNFAFQGTLGEKHGSVLSKMAGASSKAQQNNVSLNGAVDLDDFRTGTGSKQAGSAFAERLQASFRFALDQMVLARLGRTSEAVSAEKSGPSVLASIRAFNRAFKSIGGAVPVGSSLGSKSPTHAAGSRSNQKGSFVNEQFDTFSMQSGLTDFSTKSQWGSQVSVSELVASRMASERSGQLQSKISGAWTQPQSQNRGSAFGVHELGSGFVAIPSTSFGHGQSSSSQGMRLLSLAAGGVHSSLLASGGGRSGLGSCKGRNKSSLVCLGVDVSCGASCGVVSRFSDMIDDQKQFKQPWGLHQIAFDTG